MSEPASESPPSLNEWAQQYYLHPRPEETPRILAELTLDGMLQRPDTHWQTFGLFTELFVRHPERVASWLEGLERLGAPDQAFLLRAAWLSGSPESRAVLSSFGVERARELLGEDFDLEHPPDPGEIPIEHPGILDHHWSRFFVSGDPTHVRRVIDCLPLRHSQPRVTDEGGLDTTPLAIGSAAQFSLIAIAREHPAVCEILRAELEVASGATAAELGGILQILDDIDRRRAERDKRRWWQFWKRS